MPEEEKTDCSSSASTSPPQETLWGTLSNTPQLPRPQQENETQTYCQSWK